MSYPFLKGHGTENDFVLLPDVDGTVHGDLAAERVRALCDRRAGIGADGVLRVVRREGRWFMDYRNADGSVAEMCGNGIRVFVRYLVGAGLVDPTRPVDVDTRDGVKQVTVDGDLFTVDLGAPKLLGETEVGLGERRWPARHVDMGNPHAVALLGPEELAVLGSLGAGPAYDQDLYPSGVNVELVATTGWRQVSMRVHERGSGETRSCGTGAGAAMVAAAEAAGDRPAGTDVAYRVGVPGGGLLVTWTADDRVLLSGPAVLVARGTTDL